MSEATFALLLAVIGLPTCVGTVALVARHLVHSHAEQYAECVRVQVRADRRNAMQEATR